MLSAAAARAEDSSVSVSTAADSAKLGGEFRSELNYNNNLLKKEDGAPTPKASTTLEVQTVKIKLRGNLNKETEYAFRFNLNPTAKSPSPFDYGYGTHWFTDMFGWSIGKMKVVQGGWDQLDGSYRDHAVGAYRSENLPFSDYEAMTALHIKAAGKVSLQILNDYSTTSATHVGEWNKNAHPTYALGWQGDFGGLMPLIDFGAYDNQKSKWFDVGFKAKLAGVDASLDVGQNMRTHNYSDAAGKSKAVTDTSTNIALRAGYEIAGVVKPAIYFASYDNKEGANETGIPATKDVKFNTTEDASPATATSAAKPAVYKWDDNGQTIGVSADLLNMGKNFNPYFAVVMQSGKWADASGNAKSHSNMQVRVGALGEF